MGARSIGRYQVFGAFASGGMASVHLGRMTGSAGFAKTVAIKQLHASFAEEPAIVSSILDEARLASRIQHPSVVATLDVVVDGADILLVLEYVHGESLAKLLRATDAAPPLAVVNGILASALHGLHAAHEATTETGEPLGIVHRDVSPQNILVGADGLARVLDFGIAKARGRLQTTREGQVKGKLAYMAPEQIRLGEVGRATDVFAAGVVLWEALTGERLFAGENEGHVMMKVLEAPIPPPSSRRPEIPSALDDVVMRALDRDPSKRWPTARDFALALEASGPIAPASQIGGWVVAAGHDALEERASRIAAIERTGVDQAQRRAHAADLETRTDAGLPPAEVTRTETRGLSIEASATEPPQRRRRGLAFAALVGAIGVASAAAFMASRPEQKPAAPSPATSNAAQAASSAATTLGDADPRAQASVFPSPSSTAGASAPQPPRPGIPPRPQTAAPPASPTPTAAPASSKPFYRFE
ncbi:MAG: protein kinase [Myxococcales bacterium]|nr:protein kinase [Myxococcales bacterium]